MPRDTAPAGSVGCYARNVFSRRSSLPGGPISRAAVNVSAPRAFFAFSTMGRLIPFLVFIALAIFFASFFSRIGRPHDPRTYRPRQRWNGPFGSDGAPAGTVHVVKRSELAGVRDAYSSAPIDPAKPLLRCGKCLSLYHSESVAALDRENHGRCATCGGTDLAAVHVIDG